jgi:L-threonylcarbamoyladenylate synthase
VLVLDDSGVEQAAAIIKSGGLAAFPTETVYGLGADAFNSAALARVFEAKGRPRFDPLIIHIAGPAGLDRPARLSELGADRRALLEKLAGAFWPGPLTLVLPKRPELPGLATAGLSTVAVRVPSHPLAQKLIRLSGPLAAPSANPFGRLSPTRAEHVVRGLGGVIDCVIDGGPCSVGIESAVLDLCSPEITLLRPGGISREELEAITGPLRAEAASGQVSSPGMLKSHYAPRAPVVLHPPEEMALCPFTDGEAMLFFSGKTRAAWLENGRMFRAEATHPAEAAHPAGVLTLSETGAVLEAAANLFDFLHRLDTLRPVRIHAETLPPSGLGAAINDRLSRAAAR